MGVSPMTSSTLFSTPARYAEHASALSIGAKARAVLAIAFGVALTLAMQGYQFGKSNHTVYLIDALRHTSPKLLQNDWFATQTLQYHAAFGLLTRALMHLGIIEPAFLIGYVLLAVLIHTAWWRIVKALGGGIAAYVLSEILFHLAGAGTGLGMYQILQDSAFLPSNIAAVAMLWGIYFWIVGNRGWSAVLFGVSGLFHLNYAIVAPFTWFVLTIVARLKDRRRPTTMEWFGAIAMLELCLMNLIPAMLVISQRTGKMPLSDFVQLYVTLRHPHHYAPLSWPIALWLTFLLPLPFAWLYWWRQHDENDAVEQARRIVDLIVLLLVIAFFGAGIWYVSETLVQLSLWRFSVFVKLLTCAAAAMWIVATSRRHERLITTVSSVLGVALIAACIVRGPYLGFLHIADDDRNYYAACDWIRDHAPQDAIFLVPPDEQAFRLHAQRAIVVNFKCIPQLSGELPEWHRRLRDVVGSSALHQLPDDYDRKLKAIRLAYDSQSPAHLAKVAQHYNARYLLVAHRLDDAWESRRVAAMDDATTAYFLYDLQR
jgi:hypothetical protein